MTVEPPAGGPPQQRATDADRDQAFSLLHEAYADGRLDRIELDERLDQVSASKTRHELAVVTADLQHAGQGDGSDRVVLRSTGSRVKRNGRWSVPRHLVVEAAHAHIRLDLGPLAWLARPGAGKTGQRPCARAGGHADRSL